MSTVSVIIPIYNGERFVAKTIAGVLNQTYRDFELLLINDGSTDNSRQIIESYARKDSRILCFSKENQGICATRNYGIKKAKGTFVVFIDQDDEFDNRMLEDYVSTIECDNSDMCVFGRSYTLTDELGRSKTYNLQPRKDEVLRGRMEIIQHIFNVYNDKTFLTIWNCIYKRSIIEQNLVSYSEDLKAGYEDTLFNMQYASHCSSISLISRIHYRYQLRSGISTISKGNANVLQDFNFIANKTYELIDGSSNDEKNAYGYFLLRFMQVPYFRLTNHNKCSFYDKVNIEKSICSSSLILNAQNCKLRPYVNNNYLYITIWNIYRLSIKLHSYWLAVIVLETIKKLK